MKTGDLANLRKRAPVPKDDCGMAQAAELFGERWVLLILRELFYGVACFEDMRADLGIPSATLRKRLASLEAASIVARVEYQAPNDRPRQGYCLTESGLQLGLTFLALRQWGDQWLKAGRAVSELVDAATGDLLRVALVAGDGREVPLERSRLKPLKETEND